MAGHFHGGLIVGPSCSWLDMAKAMAGYGHSHGWIMQGIAVFGQLPMAYQARILGGTWLFRASHDVPV